MKVETIHYYAGCELPGQSAASVHVALMTQSLAREVSDVIVFAKGKASTTLDEISAYYGLTTPAKFDLVPFVHRGALFQYLRRVARSAKPDLVVGRYVYPVLMAALRGQPVVYEVHAPASGYKRAVEALLFRQPGLCCVVAITQALANRYVHDYPHLANRICVLPDAANDPGQPVAPRAKGVLTVTYAGSWYAGRGVELIVKMAERLPNMNFVAAGGTKAELAERGIDCPYNLECAGFVPPAEVGNILRKGDVLIAPYQTAIEVAGSGGDTASWASPMKFFEYMSHGKAIVCSDLPVFHEVFEDGGTCLFVPPADLDAWCAALERLDQDRDIAVQLGAQARQQFLSRHTWQRRAQMLLTNLISI